MKIIEMNPRLIDMGPEREIGVEVEMEGAGLPIRVGGWVCTKDGSLRGEAVEYVLAKPTRRATVGEALKSLDTAYKAIGAVVQPSDRCGVHIHVNMQYEEFMTVMNMISLFMIFETPLVHYCGGDREGNLFCLRSQDAEAVIIALTNCMKDENFNHAGDNVRYAACNIAALNKYGSLEFRSLRTPFKMVDIEEWVKLLLKLKDAARKFDSPKAILENLSAVGPQIFLNNVFEDMSKYLLHVDNLDAHIMEDARRVQDVAYAKVLTAPGKYKVRPKKRKPPFDQFLDQPEAAPQPPPLADVPEGVVQQLQAAERRDLARQAARDRFRAAAQRANGELPEHEPQRRGVEPIARDRQGRFAPRARAVDNFINEENQ